MANDKWQFAKIDVNWGMNPKWFQVERSIRDQIEDSDANRMRIAMPTAQQEIRIALLEAQHLHLLSILYSVQFMTDGVFPVSAIKGLARCEHEEAVTALFEVGMWINLPGGMAEIHDFLKHQTSSHDIKNRSDAGKKGAAGRWGNDANGNADRNADRNATTNADRNAKGMANKNKNKNKNNTPINTPTGDKNKRREYSPEFTEFWNAFPSERKADKPKCAEKFTAAIKAGVEAQTIITAAQRYAADPNRESAFTVNPHRWLNEERWESGPLPPRAGSDPRANMTRSQRAAADAIQMHLANERPDLYGQQRQIGELS